METELDLFAGIAVSDYERALEWYERLLGSPPTFQAHETESVWTLAEHGHVNVLLSPEHAGHSQVTLFLGDLDAFVDAAERAASTRSPARPTTTASARSSSATPTATSSAWLGRRSRD